MSKTTVLQVFGVGNVDDRTDAILKIVELLYSSAVCDFLE